jgi:hypothetical protein
MNFPAVKHAHIQRLIGEFGLYEHALGTEVRKDHGYCTDDNARLLVLLAQQTKGGPPGVPPNESAALRASLSRLATDFVLQAQHGDGTFRNRRNHLGDWTDEPSNEDCWGRATWGLGLIATTHDVEPFLRRRAQHGFNRAVTQRSPHVRAMAFATLGCVNVLAQFPGNRDARGLVGDYLDMIPELFDPSVGTTHPATQRAFPVVAPESVSVEGDRARQAAAAWLWPEPRLRYANASIAEALIAGGVTLHRADDVEKGLDMLSWLLGRETRGDHLSVTGQHGAGPADVGPQFDQQPIEVAAMADACWRALEARDAATDIGADIGTNTIADTAADAGLWVVGIQMAANWFMGANDVGVAMHDAVSGGAYDGLTPTGPNQNQGAESTLAFLTTMQRCVSLATLAPV